MVNGKGKVEGQEGAKVIRLIQQWKHESGLLTRTGGTELCES